MPRQYSRCTGSELERLVEDNSSNRAALAKILAELKHRKRPKMRALRGRVEGLLGGPRSTTTRELQFEPPRVTPEPTVESSPQASEPHVDSHDAEAPDDRFLPSTFCLVSPTGVTGRPAKYVRPPKTDVSLDLTASSNQLVRFQVALEALIADMRRTDQSGRRFLLENGKAVSLDGQGYGYEFHFIEDATLFEDADIEVQVGASATTGRVVALLPGRILISVDDDFGPIISACVLKVDATVLLEALRKRLKSASSGEINLNRSLANATISGTAAEGVEELSEPSSYGNLNESQQDAIRQALVSPTTYIWGPPGTGKTQTLTALIDCMFSAGKRVLLCSNTNQAVDQVLLKLCKSLGTSHDAMQSGRVVRLGRVANAELADRFSDYVTLDGIVARLSVELHDRREHLSKGIASLDERARRSRGVLAAFEQMDTARSAQREAGIELTRCEQAVQRTSAVHSQTQSRIDALEESHEARRTAGAIRRVFMRSEASIRSGIESARRQLASHISQRTQALESLQEAKSEVRSIARRIASLQQPLSLQDRPEHESLIKQIEQQLTPLRSELSEISAQLDAMSKSIMADARILGATVTKAYLSAQELGQFDAVIVDEASMVMTPALYFVAGMSSERVVISGDFRQLAPIVPTDQKAILDEIGDDVFVRAGINTAAGTTKTNVQMLHHQYRMDDHICRLISGFMYDGRLMTAPDRDSGHISHPPAPLGPCLTVVDTSRIWPFESVNPFRSRFNLMHSLLVRNLCLSLKEQGFMPECSVGVCTPYAAQARLTRRILDDNGLSGVVTGTVHRYQGDEKDLMVIDVPESVGGGRGVGMFLQGDTPSDDGCRLINVAVSRAKSHLVIFANLTYLDGKLPSYAFLRSILCAVQQEGHVVDATEILALRPISTNLRRYGTEVTLDLECSRTGMFKQSDFEVVCLQDMARAKKSIVVFSGFYTANRLSSYANLFRERISRGVQVRCVTRPPKSNGSMDPDESKQALDSLEALGVVVDLRLAIHEKVVFIDDEIAWFGSLNPLSHTNRTDEAMMRTESSRFVEQAAEFLSIGPSQASHDGRGPAASENPRCPDCTSRTVFTRGKHGPFFACEHCNWKQSANKPVSSRAPTARRGVVVPAGPAPPCPKCRGRMVKRSGRYGEFFGCSSYPRCKGTARTVPGARSRGGSRPRGRKK